MKTFAPASGAISDELQNELGFHTPEPEDIRWAGPILRRAGRMGCEYSFGNIYAWADVYHVEIAQRDGNFLSRSLGEGDGGLSYGFPVGPGELRETIELLRRDAARNGTRLELYGLTREDTALLDAALPGGFDFLPCQGDADYLYQTGDLADLPGKKYHQKRNHISYFEKNNRWSYEEITQGNADECLALAKRWMQLNRERNPKELEAEYEALRRCFAHYDLFGCRGGLLRVEGEAAAFCLGEALNGTTFCTHFEKAFIAQRGAYQMINREFAARTLREFLYINREEDTGDEGLRKAKLSYYPALLLEKFHAVSREGPAVDLMSAKTEAAETAKEDDNPL
ncbi:MAG: phosphatidylglycerol lysyltransferase domain-containing protein [Oscillospiraceae bacterium]|jgi:hypothetical protein|nr:phosphatidylglycerol lysyltransferase domain-containing protein [Oscillospiraceae bacterium]